MRTAGVFDQDTPQSDGVINIIGWDFHSTTAGVSLGTASGLFYFQSATSGTSNIFGFLDNAIFRLGALASQASGFQAFGTKGPPPVPGPSSVANTSGPSAVMGHPPLTRVNLPTIKGPVRGALPKGLQFNYVDVIYAPVTVNCTSISFSLTSTKYGLPGAGATVPVVSNIITAGQNGLQNAVAANPVTTRVLVPTANQSMIITPETFVIVSFVPVCPSTGVCLLYGMQFGVSYNYN